jgi:hypothetical protein
MHLLFLITAAVGCTLLAIQILLQILGLDHDFAGDLHVDAHAGDGGHDSSFFFGLLSLKSLTAFLAFFGLAGLAADELGVQGGPLKLVIATLAGVAAMAIVVLMMRGMVALQSSGTLRIEKAVGQTARVYLRIPGQNAGTGKITVQIDQREVELQAMTPGPTIPTGAMVEVVRQIDVQTFEVTRVR